MATGRNERCPCGSGRKYKHCCAAAARQSTPSASRAEALKLASQLHDAGQFAQAEKLYRQMLVGDPANAQVTLLLGMCVFQAGRAPEAVALLERALVLNPGNDAAHNNLGYVRLQQGEVDAACTLFRRAIQLNPGNAMAHSNLGDALRTLGDFSGSIDSYRSAAMIDPENPQARFNLGRALVHAGRPQDALPHLRTVVRLAPGAKEGWQWLADALAPIRFDVFDAGIEAEVAACLTRPDIEPAYLASAAASLLRADTAFHSLLPPAPAAAPYALTLDAPALRQLTRPLFLHLLENTFISESDFEQLVAAIRRVAMLAWRGRSLGIENAALRELLAAVAHQCFLTDYLHAEQDDEIALVVALGQGIEATLASGGSINEAEVALFACYRPLGTLRGSDTLPAGPASLMGRLVMRQVREPAEEAHINTELKQLTPISNDVSLAVQAQYEHHPYPRWLRAPSADGAYPLAQRLQSLFPHAGAAGRVAERPSILIAGCGTGRHAAMTAALNPDSRILAIDLSRASLAYAARRARESGISNIEFAQADILALGAIEERFDVIQCSGVLHHMQDPQTAWAVLTGLLAPGGKMKVGLYSEVARRSVVAARQFIADRQFAADLNGMRAARQAILALPSHHPARSVAAPIDFYSMPGCRDLLFHVQEHRFALPAIAAILDDLALEFLGFEFEFAATRLQFEREFPLDLAATSLANWTEFEIRHPDTFAAMYQFWVTPRA